MSNDSKIDNLIGNLSEELAPEKPLPHPALRLLPWLVLSIIYLTLVIYFVGMRHDMMIKLNDQRFLLELSFMGFIGITSAIASVFLCVPDMRGQKWLLSLPFLGIGGFVVWNIMHLSGMTDWNMKTEHVMHCAGEGAFMSVVPLAMMFLLTKQGSTTKPILMGFMNVFAVSAVGYIGLRFTCPLDSFGHATMFHLIPYVIMGCILGALARKLYRW